MKGKSQLCKGPEEKLSRQRSKRQNKDSVCSEFRKEVSLAQAY